MVKRIEIKDDYYQIGKIRRLAGKVINKNRILFFSIVGIVFLLVTPMLTYAHYAQDITDRERLMNRNSTGIILRDRHGQIFYEYGKISAEDDLKLSQISDNVENALIASEDKDFFKHEGYSIKGMGRALYANLLNQDPSRYGGSTITQQLVKNKLLSADKNYFRKYQEVSMAVAVERKYSKTEILEMYLNSVYFGEGAFGISDAAKTYFSKSPQDLTVAESSMLVGLLPAPSAYSPISGDKDKALKQQQRVLEKMAENGYIDQQAKEAALADSLKFAPPETSQFDHAQHFTLMVLEELKNKYGEETMIRRGFEVTTTLDLQWQKEAEQKARDKIATLQSANARNAGLVAIDPKSGEIRALVGSIDWHNEKFGKVNMATSVRQPGSSFKPIYYTEAINRGIITASTILKDEPRTFGRDQYQPLNYDKKYRGDLPVRSALAQSLNIPSVEVMEKLGVSQATETAQRMGITTVTEPQKYGLSLGLGTAEVKLLEMVNAYSAFANKGQQFTPSMINDIKDKFDEKIEVEETKSKAVTTPEASFIISSILSDNSARAPTFGSSLNVGSEQVAVKTGTTNDSRDAWTIGYTPAIAVGVWVGNNENEPMVGLAGSSSAGAIWKDTINSYLNNLPEEKFSPTPNIVQLQVCKGSGQRAITASGNTYNEFFIKGTEPKEECNKPEPPKEEKKEEPEQKPNEPRTEPAPRNRNNNNNSGPGNGNDDSGNNEEETPPPTDDEPTDNEPIGGQ